MDWTDVLERTDLVGGQIEFQENGNTFRGPVSSLNKTGGLVVIRVERLETRPTNDVEAEWERIEVPILISLSLEHAHAPYDPGDGRVAWILHPHASGIITPKGWSDPAAQEEQAPAALPTGTQYDWELVVGLKPKGYAEVRSYDNKTLFHGPVKEVLINEGDFVEIHFHWLATVPLNDLGLPVEEWKVAPPEVNPIIFPNLVVPFEIDPTESKGPRVRFGFNILYLEEVKGINPERVQGLVLPTSPTGEGTVPE